MKCSLTPLSREHPIKGERSSGPPLDSSKLKPVNRRSVARDLVGMGIEALIPREGVAIARFLPEEFLSRRRSHSHK